MKNGMTLIEIIVALIIMGFVIGLALPSFNKLQESAKDKEAIGNLRRIQEAEKFSFLEKNSYYPSAGSQSNIGLINDNLKLSLPTVATRDWNYTVNSNGCGQATRISDGRNWYFRIADDGSDSTDCNKDGIPNTNSCYTCP